MMECPNCQHKPMHHVGSNATNEAYWCPECGVLRQQWGDKPDQFALSKPKQPQNVDSIAEALLCNNKQLLEEVKRFRIMQRIEATAERNPSNLKLYRADRQDDDQSSKNPD